MAGMVLAGWFLSVAALVVGVALLLSRISSGSAERAWRPLCVAIFLAVMATQVAEQLALWPDGGSPVLTALFNTIQTFILERDAPSMTDEIQALLGGLAKPYVAYGVFLSLMAPIAAAGSAVLVFSHFVSLPLLWLRSGRRETYVFSELNESALALASSIQSHYASLTPLQRCVIAFARSAACEDDELQGEARMQGMLLSKMPIERLMRWCRGREHCHMVLSKRNGSENVSEGLHLSEMVPQASKRLAASVHVFSDVADTEGFADIMAQRVAQKGGCMVRRIDPTVAAVRQALISYPLFLVGEPSKATREVLYERCDRRILILGSDALATEYMKAAVWSGRAYGLHMTIDIVDEDAGRLREHLASSCPEIASNIGRDGYDLHFHECSCSSEAFVELIRKIGCEVTYVLVSQSSDLLTAGVARRVRGLLEACRIRMGAGGTAPLVLAAVRDADIATALPQAQTPDGQPYDIRIAQCGDDLLTYESLFMPQSERRAANLNRALWGCYDTTQEERSALEERADAAFEASEFTRLSSMTAALFCKHVLFSLCRRVWAQELPVDIDCMHLPEAAVWTMSFDDASLEGVWQAYRRYVSSSAPTWLYRLEHERWMAYVRVLGYELADGNALTTLAERGTVQSQLAHLHAGLVDYDKLPAVCDVTEIALGERQAPAFSEASRAVIQHLPKIILGQDS